MKLPSLPLFTDTFTAETVHLTNEQVGIYIRLLCFAWTKNAKPFNDRIEKINKLYDKGHIITFHTARGMGRYSNITRVFYSY